MKVLNKLEFVRCLLGFLMKNLQNKLFGKKSLVISIRSFSLYGYSEAVNKQGLDFCRRLEKEKINYICISIDNSYKLMRHKNINVMCFKSQRFGLLIRLLNPDSILFFHSCLVDLFPYEDVYSQFCSLFVLTSNQPTTDIGKNNFALLNMIHLHDYGRLSLLCHSTEAQTSLQTYGFISTVYVLPFIDVSSISRKLNVSENLKSVGFASSPLQRNDYVSKGCEFFFEEAGHCKEYLFDVLWRDENVPIPVAVPKNVSMTFGKTNMSGFYEKIDCVVLPYTGKGNHSFPLSCLEAILLAIPVLVSNRCGCRDYIERHGLGVVFDVELKNFCLSLKTLSVNYTDCVSTLLAFKGSILEDVENSYDKIFYNYSGAAV